MNKTLISIKKMAQEKGFKDLVLKAAKLHDEGLTHLEVDAELGLQTWADGASTSHRLLNSNEAKYILATNA